LLPQKVYILRCLLLLLHSIRYRLMKKKQKIKEMVDLLASDSVTGLMSDARLKLLKDATIQADDVDLNDQIEKAIELDSGGDDDEDGDSESQSDDTASRFVLPREPKRIVTSDTESDNEDNAELKVRKLVSILSAFTVMRAKLFEYNFEEKGAIQLPAHRAKLRAMCQSKKNRRVFSALLTTYRGMSRPQWNKFVSVGKESETKFLTQMKAAMDILSPFSFGYGHNRPIDDSTPATEQQSRGEGLLEIISRATRSAKRCARKGEEEEVFVFSKDLDTDVKTVGNEPAIYFDVPDPKDEDDINTPVLGSIKSRAKKIVEILNGDGDAKVSQATAAVAVAVSIPTRRIVPAVVPVAVVQTAAVASVETVANTPTVLVTSKKRKAETVPEVGSMQSIYDARVKAARGLGVKPEPMTLEEARQLRTEKAASTVSQKKAKKAEEKATKPKIEKIISPEMKRSIDALVASIKARAALSSTSVVETELVNSASPAELEALAIQSLASSAAASAVAAAAFYCEDL